MKAKEGKVISLGGNYNVAAERAENPIGLRITEARKSRGWNIGEMTEYLHGYGIDLTKGAVGKWETGETVPNAYQFIAVCTALGMDESLAAYRASHVPELNEEGMKKVAQYRQDLISSGNYRPAPKRKAIHAISRVDMPICLMPAAAGTGNYLDDADYYEEISFPKDQVNPRAELGIRVSGDSMEPVYHDEQIVWVQKCNSLDPGDVGIFIYDGKAYIKVYGEQEPDEDVLEHYTTSDGTVRPQPVLISYNDEKYDPIVISPYSPFRIFGKVLK